jgi:hypothetical protein
MADRNMTGAACAIALLVAATPAAATLWLEPVINFVPGKGPGEFSFPLYDPEFLNGATGEPFATADEPREIVTYPAGVPRDEELDILSVWNNTRYVITSFTMTIVGEAYEPEPFFFYIYRDPDVDAFFGDANGDGMIGLSDIFPIITVSNGGRTITLSGGKIPVGGRFTDAIFSVTSDGLPFKAAIDASFDGYMVPEPATWAMMIAGFGMVGAMARRRNRRPAAA